MASNTTVSNTTVSNTTVSNTTVSNTTSSDNTKTNIVCVCPYCKTGYEWWVDCDCLEQEQDDEQEQEQDDEQEQEQDDEQEQEQDYIYDLVECEYCGNKWDGFAQCMCFGNLNSDPFYRDKLTIDQHGFDINEND